MKPTEVNEIKRKLAQDLFYLIALYERAGWPFRDVVHCENSWAGKLSETKREEIKSILDEMKIEILSTYGVEEMTERTIFKQIPLDQLDRSDEGLRNWMDENQKNGYKPITWRIEKGFAHFYMVLTDEDPIHTPE